MLTSKDIRNSLRRGEPVIGTWLQLPSPDVAEIVARLGYDWAAADLEHGSFTRAQLPDVFRALERWGTLPFARVAAADMTMIKAALDSGAAGLIFPMIESRKQLDDAIAWSLYPGVRRLPAGAGAWAFPGLMPLAWISPPMWTGKTVLATMWFLWPRLSM